MAAFENARTRRQFHLSRGARRLLEYDRMPNLEQLSLFGNRMTKAEIRDLKFEYDETLELSL